MPDGSGDAFIRLLAPVGLDRVPGWSGYDPLEEPALDAAWRRDYFAWRTKVIAHRQRLHALCGDDPEARSDELALCAEDPRYWLAMWGTVREPRVRKGEDKLKPFIPFAFQCHVLDWLWAMARMDGVQDGFITKARELGISWGGIVAFVTWGWLFQDVTSLVMSRTQSEVDKPNNINTLFGKVRFLLRALKKTAPWMLPEGFDYDRHCTQLNIYNPTNEAQIFGETSTAEAGVGDRAQIAFIDEAAKLRELDAIWTTLGGTAEHVVGASTEDIRLGLMWEKKWQTAKQLAPDSVMVLDWYLNPYNDAAWLEAQRKRKEAANDLAGFYSEYLRNPRKGRSGLIYPEADTVQWADADAGYDPSLPVYIGVDPGFTDETAIVFCQPIEGDPRGRIRWLDSFERHAVPAEYYAHILTGIEPEPGDVAYGYYDPRYGRDRDLMAWTRQFPIGERVKIFMDPASKNKDTSGLSFYVRLVRESKRLRARAGLPAKALAPYATELFQSGRHQHQPRQNAGRQMLARSEFCHTPGARRLLDAIKNYRQTPLTPHATSEPKPIHDEFSHLVAAFEYVASFTSMGVGRVNSPAPETQQVAA